MGCLSHPALLPACRDSGFQQKGKHRWLGARPEEIATPQVPPGAAPRQSPSPTAGRTQGAAKLCKANSVKERESEKDTQRGSSVVPARHLPDIGQPREAEHMCCYLPCLQTYLPRGSASSMGTLNPRSSQVQYNLCDMQAALVAWGMPYVTQVKPQGQWDVNRNYQLQAPAKQPWPWLFPVLQTGR